ncbi:MAG: hypothetical protein H0V34_02125 [Gammaproteobacteria bacterium]|nr:hypothetical protein [Gammaproteobacteria bacterium]
MLSLPEQALLTEACRSLPVRKSFEVTNNYVLNMLSMALDFQLRQRTVDAAFAHFKQNHRYRSHRRLRDLAESFDNTKKGNLGLARTLWNNNMWTRAQFLRCF